MEVKTISIGKLAERTGVAVSALRFYEEQGLLFPERNSGGQRRFLRSDIRRVSFILIAQQFGFTLEQINEQLSSLPPDRAPNKADWARMSERFRYVLNLKIAKMEKLRDSLNSCIGCGCLSLEKCKLYNPDDRAGRLGSGPRYLLGNTSQDLET